MPSGLTSAIYDGSDLSLASYAWRCAAQLFYHAEIPSEQDDEEQLRWPRERLEESMEELSWWKGASVEEILEKQRLLNEGAQRQFEQDVVKQRELRERYMTFRAQVESWEPPTKDHEEFKGLMLRMLDESIKHDCREPEPWGYRELGQTREERRQVAEKIRATGISETERSISRERERLKEVEENTAKQRSFLRELERVLPKPVGRESA